MQFDLRTMIEHLSAIVLPFAVLVTVLLLAAGFVFWRRRRPPSGRPPAR